MAALANRDPNATISRKFSKFEELGLITISGNKQIIVQNKLALKSYLD